MRVGIGYDVHRLVAGRRLILGGQDIPFTHGLEGHSDGDVLVHAVMDALLGALGAGDIGDLFPPTDAQWKDACSMDLLDLVWSRVREAGMALVNLDAVIVAERPKLAELRSAMQESIAEHLGYADSTRVNVKATTTEGLGFEGEGLGIVAHAVVLLDTASGEV